MLERFFREMPDADVEYILTRLSNKGLIELLSPAEFQILWDKLSPVLSKIRVFGCGLAQYGTKDLATQIARETSDIFDVMCAFDLPLPDAEYILLINKVAQTQDDDALYELVYQTEAIGGVCHQYAQAKKSELFYQQKGGPNPNVKHGHIINYLRQQGYDVQWSL